MQKHSNKNSKTETISNRQLRKALKFLKFLQILKVKLFLYSLKLRTSCLRKSTAKRIGGEDEEKVKTLRRERTFRWCGGVSSIVSSTFYSIFAFFRLFNAIKVLKRARNTVVSAIVIRNLP